MVKVVEESSPYFKIISPKDIGHKVAPGVPSVFRILFTPEENKVNPTPAKDWLCVSSPL
jgi:hydrocephalus-inducing protein